MNKVFGICLLLLLGCSNLYGQSFAEKLHLIDTPTAGTLPRGSFEIHLRMFGNGGLLSGVAVGLTPRFMIGLSYGGENIIGAGDINWNPNPGIQGRIRVIDETFATPAVTIGFDSQGYGPYNDEFNRYQIKSKGFFAAASKNYAILFNLGVHGGLNLSLENDDDDESLDFFLGADLSFNREFRFLFEYDPGRNDNNDKGFGTGDGFMNVGVQWTFSERLFVEFYLKNLLKNGPEGTDINRVFRIAYLEYF